MARHDKQSRWVAFRHPAVREFLDDVPKEVLIEMINLQIDTARESLLPCKASGDD